jgi:sec-independent protein translocase protein TatB
MNILGIGPGELVLILVIALLVVGPDRLPDLARQAGRLLVTVRNWIQRSPDAAMVLRARQEIEQELSMLRTSLLEVQNVRNEVMEAARQVSTIVTEDVLGTTRDALSTVNEQFSGISSEVQAALKGQTVARGSAVAPADPELAPPADAEAAPAVEAAFSAPAPVAPATPAATPAAPDLEELGAQVRAVLGELRALQEELRQRGALSADWRAPAGAPHQAALSDAEEPAS